VREASECGFVWGVTGWGWIGDLGGGARPGVSVWGLRRLGAGRG